MYNLFYRSAMYINDKYGGIISDDGKHIIVDHDEGGNYKLYNTKLMCVGEIRVT